MTVVRYITTVIYHFQISKIVFTQPVVGAAVQTQIAKLVIVFGLFVSISGLQQVLLATTITAIGDIRANAQHHQYIAASKASSNVPECMR